jgi:hypothetical protein
MSTNWQYLLTEYVSSNESSQLKLKNLVQLLLIEFPDTTKFMENAPLIEVRIREGLTELEKQSLTYNYCKPSKSIGISQEEKELKVIKKKTINKINY